MFLLYKHKAVFRGGYNDTQVEVKYDLNNLIWFNIILQKHSKQNK